MKKSSIRVEVGTKEITVARSFYKKASIFGTEEYKELKKARDKEPGFAIKVKEIARNRNKRTYPNLTFKNMKKYIAYKEGADSLNIQAITKLIDSADIQKSRYSFVKSWFLDNYPNYSDPDALLENKSKENSANESASADVELTSMHNCLDENDKQDKAA
jgi:hypothetical protein